ncbi:MAG: hypothetical protein KF681_01335 [Bdellovibrionaceae bacterium]|nr:hypothetical protein [Pseudobdellovibrionaceae bacterium]
MKLFIVSLFIFFPFWGSAQVEPQASNWFCTAEGLDPRTHERRQVSGDYAPTQKQAEESALRWCQGLYMGCLVKSCFDMGIHSDTLEP